MFRIFPWTKQHRLCEVMTVGSVDNALWKLSLDISLVLVATSWVCTSSYRAFRVTLKSIYCVVLLCIVIQLLMRGNKLCTYGSNHLHGAIFSHHKCIADSKYGFCWWLCDSKKLRLIFCFHSAALDCCVFRFCQVMLWLNKWRQNGRHWIERLQNQQVCCNGEIHQ